MQLEALSHSVESSINYANRIGLDGSTSEHLRQLLEQFGSEITIFLSSLKDGQSQIIITPLT